MKNLYLIISAILSFALIQSCKDESLLHSSTLIGKPKETSVFVSPKNKLDIVIKSFSDSCGILSSLKPAVIHKISGDISKGEGDTVISFRLRPRDESFAMLRYDFIKGFKYTITIPIIYNGYDKSGFGSLKAKSYFPYFECFTLQDLGEVETSVCNVNFNEFRSADDVSIDWKMEGPLNQDHNQSTTLVLSFTAYKCFKFIGFRASARNLEKKTVVHMKNVKISSFPTLTFDAKPEVYVGESQTISYGAGGFTITSPVKWYVRGDLEIIGNDYGEKIVVMCNGLNGGTVGIRTCSNTEDGMELDVKVPHIIQGPNRICSEGIYYIPTMNTIFLENESNMATLTSLGQGKYKVTALPTANGVITLVSIVKDKRIEKDITIESAVLPGIIDGPIMINKTEGEAEFHFEYSTAFENEPVRWSVDNSNVSLTQLSDNRVIMKIMPGFYFSNGQNIKNVELKAYRESQCGIVSASTIIGIRNR